MAKLTVSTETNSIRIETSAGDDAPKFAQGKPVVYEGELTAENLNEATAFFEMEMLREQEALDSRMDKIEESLSENEFQQPGKS